MNLNRHSSPGRSGITLIEILLSIMILGVGVISVATLFPLGLLRLRDANRYTRSAYLLQSAADEVNTRNLLGKTSFLNVPWYSPFAVTPNDTTWSTSQYNPLLQDTGVDTGSGPRFPTLGTSSGTSPITYTPATPIGVYAGNGWDGTSYPNDPTNPNYIRYLPPIPGPGLPVAYDPLWWTILGSQTASTIVRPNGWPTKPLTHPITEARFASGLGTIRVDPNTHTNDPVTNGAVHGLPRVTNFLPGVLPPSGVPPGVLDAAVENIFISPEDVVWQSDQGQSNSGASPLIPDMSSGQPLNDFRYTWMFTGQLNDARDASSFAGNIVVFENRPFAYDNGIAAGEIVVEAIFGYSKNVINLTQTKAGNPVTRGYGPQPSRIVVLRWQSSVMPDPEVKVGSWVADVTYERYWQTDQNDQVDAIAVGLQSFPTRRCYWYQIVKRNQATDDVLGVAGYRSMTVWVDQPLKALTLLDATGAPYHVNAALVSPYVVNAFSTTVDSQ